MRILKKVNFSEVLQAFDKEHAVNKGTNSWARERLGNANDYFGGEWYYIRLSRKEILSGVELIWHHDPSSGLKLIPETGLTVAKAKDKFLEIRQSYSRDNSDCYTKIIDFGDSAFNPIFLCTKPLKGFGIAEHEKLLHIEGNLVHIDGLHRLVAWAVAGKINWFRYSFSKKINAFVAGHVS